MQEVGVVASVDSKGDSYDNAMAESVNSLYKAELVYSKGPWSTPDRLELVTLEWVHWFNTVRLHGELDDVPPTEFEENFYRQNQAAKSVVSQ